MGICISTSALDVQNESQLPSPLPKAPRKKSIPKTLKRAVWDVHIGAERGIAPCVCCERTHIRQIEFHCGHVIAEVNGGATTVENLRPICAQCNLSMGKQNLFEFKAKYFPVVVEKKKKKEIESR